MNAMAAEQQVFMLTDVSDWKTYFADGLASAKTDRDRSALQSAIQFDDSISMGRLVVTPRVSWGPVDEANLKRHGIGKMFRMN